MSAKSDYTLSFDPNAWELSVVAHRSRTWLPVPTRPRTVVNPRFWQTRGARGFSWHRGGPAPRREPK